MVKSSKTPLAIATLYSELNDLSELDQAGDRREGGFSAKRIGGKTYWYRQIWFGHTRYQKAIGPETAELLKWIDLEREKSQIWQQERKRRRELCRALKAGLNMKIDALSGRVLARLSDKGVFERGGILIGTHAYITYGPMLGRTLSSRAITTSDIDIATDSTISVASLDDTAISFSQIVEEADPAFHVVPPRPGALTSYALKYRGGEARVEMLTPAKQNRDFELERIDQFGFGALTIPFLDYLIHHVVQATYLHDDGLKVRVPHPAWFAIHKLIVAVNRGASAQAKSDKDLLQAATLIEILHEDQPQEIKDAVSALEKFPPDYLVKAKQGAQRLQAQTRALLPAILQR